MTTPYKQLGPIDMGDSKIINGAPGTAPTDFALFGQIPLLDGTATDLAPDGVQAAGSTGKSADAGHVHQEYAQQTLQLAPNGATAETFSRQYGYGVAYPAITSGTLYLRAISIPKNVTVNNLTFMTGSSVQAGGTHGWYVLLDSSRTVQVVTADQTAAAKWGTTFTTYPLPATASYTTTYGGLFYVGVCVVATTMPTFLSGPSGQTLLTSIPPILIGSSNTGQTTPPAVGTVMNAVTGGAAWNFYAYTS